MAGRGRGRDERGGQNDTPAPERAEPRMPQAEREPQSGASEADHEAENGKKAARPRINRASGNGAGTAEEPFDIPDFFKRPLN